MNTSKTTINRKLSIYGFDSVNNGHNIYALLELDITNIRKYLRDKRKNNEGGSLFVFFIKSIATCLVKYPLFNSMINSKKTTTFESVDISIPIELERDGVVENKQYLIKQANKKNMHDIEIEIVISKQTVNDQKGYILSKSTQILFNLLPKWIVVLIIKSIMKNHKKVMELSGSVFVTSVSMYSSIPGYIIPYIGGPKASSFAIGSITKKPIVRNDKIEIREMINITAVFNHDIIDGAPAARFLEYFRELIEHKYSEIV